MPKKDPFEDLPEEWKSEFAAKEPVEILKEVSRIALNHSALMAAKAEDSDLASAQAAASEAGAVYREGIKDAKARTNFLAQVLGDKGYAIPGAASFLKKKAK
jgi:hypothetical protein